MKPYKLSKKSVELEHDFAFAMRRQVMWGFAFDKNAAVQLYAVLSGRRAELDEELQKVFPPIYLEPGAHGGLKTKTRIIVFNPASRKHIADRFQAKGWKPNKWTPEGRPQIDESVLAGIDFPEAKLLNEYLMVAKRISQLAEADGAWLKLVTSDGRIYGDVLTNATITGRCSHRSPNMAQVPNSGSPYGKECRALFTATYPDWELIGVDFSGLEIRVCASYTAPFDDGELIHEACEGDIHSANQEALGLPSRDIAKTYLYATLYGAGDEKLGSIVGGGQAAGRRLKKRFYERWPGVAKLQSRIDKTIKERGYLTGLDGRILPVRSHASLNTLLQSGGAVLMKNFTVALHRRLEAEGYKFGKQWAQVAHIHDEVQLECDKSFSASIKEIALGEIQKSGANFEFKCPLAGEAKSGRDWAATH
jgi:DNA polymerase-1